MRNITRTIFASAAAVAAVFTLGSTPASSDEATWTVSGGTEIEAINDVYMYFEDLDTGMSNTCDTSEVTGEAKNGSNLSGEGITTLRSVSFADSTTADGRCSGSIWLARITALNLPDPGWKFNAVSYDAASGATTGALSGVQMKAEFSDGCALKVGGAGSDPNATGTIKATYTNSMARIAFENATSNDLVVTIVNDSCSPLDFKVGDRFLLEGGYTITPALTITSP